MYGITDTDLTRLQRIQNRLARLATKSPLLTRSVPLLRSLHCLPVTFGIFFQISLLTYKILREKLPVYLHSMLPASLPSRSLRSNNDNSLSVPRVKTNTGKRTFALVLHILGTASRCLSVQPFQLLPSRNISRHIFFTWPFPRRHRHARWPIDAKELFLRFCC